MASDPVGMVSRFVASRYPTADAAILAGSQARGEATLGSDCDIVLLFQSLQSGAWREMTLFEGQRIEVFAHDLNTLAYFCRVIDCPSGIPALPAMVSEGIVVLARSPGVLTAARDLAAETLRLGPPPLDDADLRARRFADSELAAALQLDRGRHVLLAVGAALYTALADFALRANNHWSGSGKSLPRALAAMEPALASQFEAAFFTLFAAGDAASVQGLVDNILSSHGGRLREGYQQSALPEWRERCEAR